MIKLTACILALALIFGVAAPSAQAAQSNVVVSDTVRLAWLGLNINSAGSDNTLTIPYANYIIRRVTVTNASTSLAASPATFGVFTGAGGTGSTVVTAALLTTLSASTVFMDMTVALSTTRLTASSIFLRDVLAHGSAATVDVYVDIQPLQ